jgi:hypothetical protein
MRAGLKFAFLVLFATTAATAQTITPAQRAKFPCLDKVSGEAKDSILSLSDIPEAFKGLAPAYVGHWNEPDGSKVCTALLIDSLGGRGQGNAVYTNDAPYKRTHTMGLGVKRDGARFTLDVFSRSQGWSIDYVSEDGGKTLQMRPGQGYSGPAKSGELVAVE